MTVEIQKSPSGPFVTVATPSDAYQTIWFGGDAGAYASGTDCLRPWQPVAAPTANELVLATLAFHRAGVIKNLRAGLLGAGVVAVSPCVVTARLNQVNQLLAASIPIGQQVSSDLDPSHAINMVAFDELGIRIGATDIGSVIWVSVEWYPTP